MPFGFWRRFPMAQDGSSDIDRSICMHGAELTGRVIVGGVTLFLERDCTACKRTNIVAESTAWHEQSIALWRLVTLRNVAERAQSFVVYGTVDKRIARRSPMHATDERICCRSEYRVENGVVGC